MKVQIIKDIQNKNKFLKQKIDTLSTDYIRTKNKLIAIESQLIKSNVTKRNLLFHQVLKKNRQKKKKPKTSTSSDT